MAVTDSQSRHAPRQERSARRVARIMDAAAQIFDEVGYEAATTIAIAARANTAVGSLYQFFPNKDAIVAGLIDRYQTQLHAIFDETITPDMPHLPLPQLLDRLLDPLLDFELGQHGFKALFIGVPTSAALTAVTQSLTDDVVLRVATIFRARLPTLLEADALRHSLVCVQIVKSFLALAISSQTLSREDVIVEMKTVLLRYVKPIDSYVSRATKRNSG
jgi:AcrR family transcriptional regulator